MTGLALLLMAAAAQPALAQPSGSPVPSARTVATPVSVSTQAEEREALRHDRDVAQIRADLIASQTNWFAILVSVLMGGFSLIVAVVVIIFTFRFGSAAVAEAKQGIAEEREKIQNMLDEASKLVANIKSHEQTARDLTQSLKPGEVPASPADRQTLRDIANEAQAKPRRERTLDDYRALIIAALVDADWLAMERRAAAMEYMFEDADDESRAFALFNRAYALGALDRSNDAIAVYDEVVRRFGVSKAPALQEQVAMALFNKGVRLGALGRSDDEIAVYDEVVRRFGASEAPALQEGVAKALFNKGNRLGALDRSDDQIAVYDEVVRRFGASEAPALQEPVAKALVNKGITLGALDRSDDEIAVYDEVVRRFGGSEAPALQEQVAMALVNKGITLGALGRSDDEIAVYDEVVRRFGASEAPALQERVAMALVYKGITLGALDRSDDEIAAYDEVVRRFGASEAPALQEQVAMALFNKACWHGKRADVPACLAALALWRDHRGSLDCQEVSQDKDFDSVRGDPAFQAFLRDNGCAPPDDPVVLPPA